MFRQTALRFARVTPISQPTAYQAGSTVFTQKTRTVCESSSRAFSTRPRTAINRGFWTAEGKCKDSTATLFKKAQELRIQQEQLSQERSQEEARKCEEVARKQREAVSASGS